MKLSVGVDAGSAAVKVLVLGSDGPLSWRQEPTGPDIEGQCRRMVDSALQCRGCKDSSWICATGYGRNLVKQADERVSEIVANAVGVGWLWRHWEDLEEMLGASPCPAERPRHFRTIIDVGGQDVKVVRLTNDGVIGQFAMNDRCAAGTGRFLEVMSRVLGTDLAHMDEMALQSDSPAAISSACTVFAESEVVSLLSEGRRREDVAAGVYESVGQRTAALALQLCRDRSVRSDRRAGRSVAQNPAGVDSEVVVLDGGPAASKALRRALQRRLGAGIVVPPRPEFVTALGAALFGRHTDTSSE